MKDELYKHIKKVIKRDGLDTDSREQQHHYRRIFLYALLRKYGYSLTNSGQLFKRHPHPFVESPSLPIPAGAATPAPPLQTR